MAGKGKRGPETLFQRDFIRRARMYALSGWTETHIAEAIGVDKSTVTKWKKVHPDFKAAIEYGKEHADAVVTRALFRRAIGFKKRTEKVFCNKGFIVRAEVLEYFPPDVAAATFWLKKRLPTVWGEAPADTTDETTIQAKALEVLERLAAGKVQSAAGPEA